MNQSGFTLIELIIIIVVLGVLAVSAVPIYYNLTDDAKESSEKGVVGNVKAGIMLYYVNSAKSGGTPAYPTALDAEAKGTTSSDSDPFFINVVAGGVTSGWTKTDTSDYKGPAGNTYAYSSTNGTFLKQ
jgi:prepilin-type N-terminal cleavage/methylation domain-containing protein